MGKVPAIEDLLSHALSEYCFSGYQVVSAFNGKSFSLAGGKTSHSKTGVAVTPHTFFDIGSLTKVIVTTSCLARALDRKEIALTDSIGKFASVFAKSAFGKMELGALLCHSAGLEGWVPIYKDLGKQNIEDWILKHEKSLLGESGKVVYSDVGFILLGFVLKKIWGGINEAFQTEVVKPLRLGSVSFLPVDGDCAATEYCLYRKKMLEGEVFDENTWALGGTSSHAGLFATAEGLAPWCEEWLLARQGKSSWLTEKTAMLVTSRVGKNESMSGSSSGSASGSSWGYGWDTRSKAFSSAGQYLSLKSFGHLGYPGVSVWIDPEKKGYVIFFTNRIHPSRVDERIKRIRPLLHDEVARFWGFAS